MCACACASVMSIGLFVFLHVCPSPHLLPGERGTTKRVSAWECRLFQHVCDLRESCDLELEYVLMSVFVEFCSTSRSLPLFLPAFDSSNKFSRSRYAPRSTPASPCFPALSPLSVLSLVVQRRWLSPAHGFSRTGSETGHIHALSLKASQVFHFLRV